MRRKDREIIDLNEIFAILEHCTVVTLGFNTETAPYLVPMTFGCALEDGHVVIYWHCAEEGRKLDLLARDNRVGIEADIYLRVENTGHGITARYESVIGSGICTPVEDPKAKISALRVMLDHYNSSGFPVESCTGLSKTRVYRIDLDEISGKRNK